MAKLAILAAALAALLALSEASTYTTTTTIEEDNPSSRWGSQSCQEQFQQQQHLQHCTDFLSQLQRSPFELAMRTGTNQQQQQHFKQCCQQLENMQDQCRCEGLRQMMREQQEQGTFRGEEMQRMTQMARELPSRCDLRPQECQFRATWV